MMENNKSLLLVAEEFTFQYGIGVIPVDGSKHQVLEKVVDKRGRVATREELEDFFGPNGSKKAQWLAIILDSPKPLAALDLDGNGLGVFQNKIPPRCSEGLKIAINTTMRTKTPRNGLHIIFKMRSEDFPSGVHTREYWRELGNGKGHSQINLMGTGYYLVERGPGYKSINDLKCLVTLSKKQVKELLYVLEHFESEAKAIRNVCETLVKYYQLTNRQNIALRLSGYLHKHGVQEYLIRDLIEHLIELAGGDEESEKRYRAVRDTCSKNANTDQVSGYAKLLEVVSGDESVILTIQKEFSKLGYHFLVGDNGNDDDGNAHNGVDANTDNSADQQEDRKQKTAGKSLEIVERNIEKLFKDQLNNAFTAVRIGGHIETIPITNNGKFKMWVYKTYYETQGQLMTSADALSAVCTMLQSKAHFGKKMIDLGVRTSSGNGLLRDTLTIHYDLTNSEWEQVARAYRIQY